MKKSDFSKAAPGRLVRTLQGNLAFVPRPLPPQIEWSAELINQLAAAAAAMGRLSQISRGITSPLLIRGINNVLAAREAQLSSRIEAIHTSVTQVLLLQEGLGSAEDNDEDSAAQETRNYLDALYEGLEELAKPRGLPLSNRLIRRLHATLMRGVRGQGKRPGEFRKEQNYIGSRTRRSEADAIYVPPPPQEMLECMQQLEQYLHQTESVRTHPFVRAAWVHYQFEAIHPFLDGNGRCGRLLIMLLLCSELGLDEPLLYPSAWFERQRSDYYSLLLQVSTEGTWSAWLSYFLQGMEAQALEALGRFEQLGQLREDYIRRISSSRAAARLMEIADHLFGHPFTSSALLEEQFGLSPLTAQRYLKQLQELEILETLDDRKRSRVFVARQVMDVVEGT